MDMEYHCLEFEMHAYGDCEHGLHWLSTLGLDAKQLEELSLALRTKRGYISRETGAIGFDSVALCDWGQAARAATAAARDLVSDAVAAGNYSLPALFAAAQAAVQAAAAARAA